jgi:hypothetical protein
LEDSSSTAYLEQASAGQTDFAEFLWEPVGSTGHTVGSTSQFGLEGDLGDIVTVLFLSYFLGSFKQDFRG